MHLKDPLRNEKDNEQTNGECVHAVEGGGWHQTKVLGSEPDAMEWLVVPFGLDKALPYFQRKTEQDFDYYRSYIDDIVICSRDLGKHLKHLEEAFKRLQAPELMALPGECVF